jgi:hypothetical protein
MGLGQYRLGEFLVSISLVDYSYPLTDPDRTRVTVSDVQHHTKALVKIDQGNDIGSFQGEGRIGGPEINRKGIDRPQASGFPPFQGAAPATGTERPGVKLGLSAGAAVLINQFFSVAGLPERPGISIGPGNRFLFHIKLSGLNGHYQLQLYFLSILNVERLNLFSQN